MNTFIFTCGDINGLGPEIVVKTLNKIVKNNKDKFYFVCPENIFREETKKIGVNFKYEICNSESMRTTHQVSVISFGNFRKDVGKPTKQSGRISFKAIEIAFDIVRNFSDTAIITAPISKKALSLAQVPYTGHTEMFADWCKVKSYAMMFLSKSMKAMLSTIHKPLKDVSYHLNKNLLSQKFKLALETLIRDFRVTSPKIAVLGLNPHAGEDGLIGGEERNLIIPFMKQFPQKKYFSGPFSADAFFGTKQFRNFNMILGMYHDQVLIPFKLMNFNRGVNFTAGLPLVRTSPDHGTAYDIAGKGIASESSMIEAFKYAKMILNNRKLSAKNSKKQELR